MAVIEHSIDGSPIVHHCPRCTGAIAVENVSYGSWTFTEIGGRLAQQRTVGIYCDHCESRLSTSERRQVVG